MKNGSWSLVVEERDEKFAASVLEDESEFVVPAPCGSDYESEKSAPKKNLYDQS